MLLFEEDSLALEDYNFAELVNCFKVKTHLMLVQEPQHHFVFKVTYSYSSLVFLAFVGVSLDQLFCMSVKQGCLLL